MRCFQQNCHGHSVVSTVAPDLSRQVRAYPGVTVEVVRRAKGEALFCLPDNVLVLSLADHHHVSRLDQGMTEEFCFRQHTFGFFPAGVTRWRSIETSVDFLAIYQPPAVFQNLAFEAIGKRGLQLDPVTLAEDPVITKIALSLAELADHPGAGDDLLAEHLALALAVRLASQFAGRVIPKPLAAKRLSKRQLCRVTDYIEAHLEASLTLEELAQVACLSPWYFSRAFKGATGIAPHRFVIQCRIERAKNLLLKTDMPLAEVAYACGFSSQSHFTTRFQAEVALTPRQLRHMAKG